MLTKNFTLCTLILVTILMVSGCTNDDQTSTELSFNNPEVLAEVQPTNSSAIPDNSVQIFISDSKTWIFMKYSNAKATRYLYLISGNSGQNWSETAIIEASEPIGIINNQMVVMKLSTEEITILKSTDGNQWSEKTVYKIEDNKYPAFFAATASVDNNSHIYLATRKLLTPEQPYKQQLTLLKSEDGGESFNIKTVYEYSFDHSMSYRNMTLSENNISINGSYSTSKFFTFPIMLVSNDYGNTFTVQPKKSFTSSAIDPSNKNRVFYYNYTQREGETELKQYFIKTEDFGTTQEMFSAESRGALMFRSNGLLVRIDKNGLSQSDDQGNTWGTNYTTCTYSQAYGYSHPGIIETNTQKLWVAWHSDNKLYLMKEK